MFVDYAVLRSILSEWWLKVSPHLSKFLATVRGFWFISALCSLFCLLIEGYLEHPVATHTEASQGRLSPCMEGRIMPEVEIKVLTKRIC